MKSLLIFWFLGSSLFALPQSPGISKEAFVNEVYRVVVDSSYATYYLSQEARSSRFYQFDYGQLIQYSLKEMVPLSILNELALHAHEDSLDEIWQQAGLTNASCIGEEQTRNILNPAWEARYIGAKGNKEKNRAVKKAIRDWEKKSPGKKLVFFFSKPAFTDDHQYAVIDLDLRCDTHECGQLSTCLFRRKQDKWELIGRIKR